MLPVLTSLPTLLGYGQPVSCMILQIVRSLTILLTRRFFIHFDEVCCQLASNQSILKTPHGKWDLVLEIISRTMLLDLPNLYRARFESFWLDQFVNTSRWRKHVSRTVEHLKQTMSWVSLISIVLATLLTFCFKLAALLM